MIPKLFSRVMLICVALLYTLPFPSIVYALDHDEEEQTPLIIRSGKARPNLDLKPDAAISDDDDDDDDENLTFWQSANLMWDKAMLGGKILIRQKKRWLRKFYRKHKTTCHIAGGAGGAATLAALLYFLLKKNND